MQTLDDFEPLEYYTKTLRDKFRKNAEEYFDALVKRSGVDVAANKKAVSRYNAASARASIAERRLNSGKLLRGFLILLVIAAIIGGIILIYMGSTVGEWLYTLGGILCFVLAVADIVLLLTKIKKMIEVRQKKFEAAVQKARAIKDEAFAQMRPLHALFTHGMTRELIEMTEPDIRIDDNLDVKKFDLLSRKYGLKENLDETSSTTRVLSGTADGNPFVYVRTLNCRMVEHTYMGSIVIHWVTYIPDGKGGRNAVHHTETLTATYVAPEPMYSYDTRMYYGNEAAPDLSFSRNPTHAHTLSEGAVERKVRRGKRKLRRRMKKSLAEGAGGFTEMGNAEFDVLFGAFDRDNEVQFRMMFTPLAQKNMLSLIRSDEAYGDDFAFIKQKMLNCIRSEHAQNWNMDTDPSRYMSFDLSVSRAEFLAFNEDYFRSVYFDLAPLLSVPIYKMQRPQEFIYRDVYERNYTSYETESLANRCGDRAFAHCQSKTQSILKTEFIQKDGQSDRVRVTAHSYDGIPRVAYIPRLGGDGRVHNVPVPWTEYIPLTQTSIMEVRAVGGSREEYERKRKTEGFGAFMKRYADVAAFGGGLIAIPVFRGVYDALSDSELGKLYSAASGGGKFSQAVSDVDRALRAAEEAEQEAAAADASADASASEQADAPKENAAQSDDDTKGQ